MTGLTTGAALLAETGEGAFSDADVFGERARGHVLFDPARAVVIARAPGRFDVLGGIADYAGALVLGLPTRAAALAAAQAAFDGQVVAISGSRRIAVAAADLVDAPLADLARRFSELDAWAAYVLGPIALLAREEHLSLPGAAPTGTHWLRRP